MTELEFESDQFLTLLTEALRAGPGSPEWHDAVNHLRLRGESDVNEYELLVRARENLESGKDYRAVRAGPGFTRKLMQSIDDSPATRSARTNATTWIAGLSIAILLGAVGLIIYVITRAGGPLPAVDALANTYFAGPLLNMSFEGSLSNSEWRDVGTLRLETWHGLRPNIDEASPAQLGGGILWSQPLKSDTPVEIEANVKLQRPSKDLIAQVFITDDPDNFSEDKGIGPHELIWLFQAGQQKILLPGGRVEAQSAVGRERVGLNLRIALGRDVAIVEEQGRRLWAGSHDLSNKPRYVGVRFLRTTSEREDPGIAFTSLRVQTP
jgi:hypothetical protein